MSDYLRLGPPADRDTWADLRFMGALIYALAIAPPILALKAPGTASLFLVSVGSTDALERCWQGRSLPPWRHLLSVYGAALGLLLSTTVASWLGQLDWAEQMPELTLSGIVLLGVTGLALLPGRVAGLPLLLAGVLLACSNQTVTSLGLALPLLGLFSGHFWPALVLLAFAASQGEVQAAPLFFRRPAGDHSAGPGPRLVQPVSPAGPGS